ncbi:IclR family transcriptional regulator [Pseudaminobacter arsenicus]|uniref:IclR family transcriptional regulator n=1 Tax=Borborobacter arsenicus TaxID=1851146 RepID=A0A432V7X6_9HYPH|nr:IclR family transcriptional regulator [Pseudaminobacter arsenicus]RUM98266.1 IclR family transcriptional regulator [Pseudaminobacter arsenicus]
MLVASNMSVRSVARAAEIIKSFRQNKIQSLSEISSATQLDKGTTRRILVTLIQSGLVVQDSITQKYALGWLMRVLASCVIEHHDLRMAALPFMEQLAHTTKSTVILSVFQNRSAICLERIHDINGLDIKWWQVGGTLPLNRGTAPRVLLAYQDKNVIEEVLGSLSFGDDVENVQAARDELRCELEKIRSQGWAIFVDGAIQGLTALAVPIVDSNGRIICALSMSTLTPEMVRDDTPIHLPLMLETAALIRHALGVDDNIEGSNRYIAPPAN